MDGTAARCTHSTLSVGIQNREIVCEIARLKHQVARWDAAVTSCLEMCPPFITERTKPHTEQALPLTWSKREGPF